MDSSSLTTLESVVATSVPTCRLEAYEREFQLGWNRKVAERRPEVAALLKALGGKAVAH